MFIRTFSWVGGRGKRYHPLPSVRLPVTGCSSDSFLFGGSSWRETYRMFPFKLSSTKKSVDFCHSGWAFLPGIRCAALAWTLHPLKARGVLSEHWGRKTFWPFSFRVAGLKMHCCYNKFSICIQQSFPGSLHLPPMSNATKTQQSLSELHSDVHLLQH